MASVTQTNTVSLKRTFTLVSSPSDRENPKNPFKFPALSPTTITQDRRMSLSLKRRYPFSKPQSTASASGNISSNSSGPEVGVICEPDTAMSGCSPIAETGRPPKYPEQAGAVSGMISSQQFALQHHLQKSPDSDSTSASSSVDSSPTTTISTVEADDRTTPETSPDSPGPLMPLPTPFNFGNHLSSERSLAPPSPGLSCHRPQSPSKKPRNTKNLSLNVPPTPSMPEFPTTPVEDVEKPRQATPPPKSISAPSSPGFIVPPPPQNPRRRPSNLGLTIKLPGTLPEKRTGVNALRHHQSSPSLFSPAGAAPSGLTVPQSANFRQTSFSFQRPTFNTRWASEAAPSRPPSSDNSSPESAEILHEMDEEDDVPRSGEAKSPTYPLGPALIFEPNIYLYAEPNAELASQFDVIINVAREVLNPFEASACKESPEVPHIPIPETACTDASFTTAFESAIDSPSSMRTTVETPRPKQNLPEYVHMPWDHNTSILDDLPRLVEIISARSDEGKKVLVHCQCGVSRSATLLIAYAMFKNPEKSMQDAYSAVKAKSKWIGPNMSLIYQLTDWRKKLVADLPKIGGARGMGKGAGFEGLGRGRTLDSEADSGSILPEPQTAPLPGRRRSPSPSPLVSPPELRSEGHKPQTIRTRAENGDLLPDISSGPSSAPPGMFSMRGSDHSMDGRQSWPDADTKFAFPSHRRPSTPPRSARRPVPPKDFEPPMPSRTPPPPPPPARAAYLLEMSDTEAVTPFEGDSSEMLPPPTPSVKSPRNSGFWATVPSQRATPWGNFFADPRSPTERGASTPVIRNIFDVL